MPKVIDAQAPPYAIPRDQLQIRSRLRPEEYIKSLPQHVQRQIAEAAQRFRTALGPAVVLLETPGITDIYRNPNSDNIWVDSATHGPYPTEFTQSDDQAMTMIGAVAGAYGRQFDAHHPRISTIAPGTTMRCSALCPPLSPFGVRWVLRVPGESTESLEDYERKHIATHAQIVTLKKLIMGRQNILIAGGMGAGKALADGTLVQTPDGPRPIGALKVNDYVTGSDGRPTRVVAIFPQGELPAFRIRTNDECEVLACADHLWPILSQGLRRRNRAAQSPPEPRTPSALATLPIRQLSDTFETVSTRVMLERWNAGEMICLPTLAHAVHFAARPHLREAFGIDPYDIGRQIRCEARNDEFFADESVNFNELAYVIARASVDDRMAYIHGFLADDAALAPIAVCEPARKQLRELIVSLGGRCEDREDAIILELPPFTRPRLRRVASIESTFARRMTCIAVEAEDRLFLLANGLLTHNTTLADAMLGEMQRVFPHEVFAVIEDTTELRITDPKSFGILTNEAVGVGLKEAVREALRQSATRLIVGEIRDSLLAVLKALSTGHRGNVATIHGEDPTEVLDYIHILLEEEKIRPDPKRISRAFDAIVALRKVGTGRLISHIVQIKAEGEQYRFLDLVQKRGLPLSTASSEGHRPPIS